MSNDCKNTPLVDLGVVAVSLYFTGSCDLQCTYCFQPKIKNHMKDENDKIREWLKSGKMEEDVLRVFGENIEALALWGGEPSINLDLLTERLESVYNKFPKLDSFSWSSNFASDRSLDVTKKFIQEVNRLNTSLKRLVKVNIQISIDGIPEINDKNRIGSRADRIMDHTTELLRFLNENKEFLKFFSMHFKGTHGSESLKWLAQPGNLKKHYDYFDEYRYEWEQEGFKYIPLGAETISLVYPGNYTQEDGYTLRSILETLYSSEFKKGPWKSSILPNFDFQFGIRLKNLLPSLTRGIIKEYKNEMECGTSCSAGRSCCGIDYNGNLHWCQSTYFFDKGTLNYIENNNLTTDFEKNQGYSFRNFDNYVKGVEVVNTSNPLAISRSLMIPREYISGHALRSQQTAMTINELAACGLIDRKYAEDKSLQNIVIAFFLYTAGDCPANNVWEFGSVWIKNNGIYKLLLNGAFDLMMNQEYLEKDA